MQIMVYREALFSTFCGLILFNIFSVFVEILTDSSALLSIEVYLYDLYFELLQTYCLSPFHLDLFL